MRFQHLAELGQVVEVRGCSGEFVLGVGRENREDDHSGRAPRGNTGRRVFENDTSLRWCPESSCS